MNYRERLLQIRDFLEPYQKIWQNEIMLMYPAPFDGYSMEWIEELRQFQEKDVVIKLEKKEVYDSVKHPDLLSYYRRIEELCHLPEVKNYPPMEEEPFTWLYVIPKKKHEIQRLAPHLNHLYQERKIERIMDIGGGIGILAQALNNQYRLRVTSIDANPALQKTGVERHEKYAKDKSNKITYQNVRVGPDGEFSSLLEKTFMPVGLHTCGRLAVDILRESSKKKVSTLVNFGCCYQTLDKAEDIQNISAFAKEHTNLWMSGYALTLASRAHRKMDEADYDLKLKVKFYRYAIHILLFEEYQVTKIISLGNSSPKLYNESFGVYVLEQFKRIGMTPKHSLEELNAFFQQEHVQVMIQRMLAAGLIRNALGRVLEVYLQLDRAIYLEEMGYEVFVEEFFDEELSPRNIGITACLS